MATRVINSSIYKMRLFAKFIKYSLVMSILGLVTIAVSLVYFSQGLPDPTNLMNWSMSESTKIFDRTGETVLYEFYGEDTLSSNFSKVENVFFNEIDLMENISMELLMRDIDVSDLLTIIDTSMQKQAFLTGEIWLEAFITADAIKENVLEIIDDIWEKNYTLSLDKMKNAVMALEDVFYSTFRGKIIEIALDICKSRIDVAKILRKGTSSAVEDYEHGSHHVKYCRRNRREDLEPSQGEPADDEHQGEQQVLTYDGPGPTGETHEEGEPAESLASLTATNQPDVSTTSSETFWIST